MTIFFVYHIYLDAAVQVGLLVEDALAFESFANGFLEFIHLESGI